MTAWTASTSPAWTEVIRWGARTEWKIWRASRAGVRSRAVEAATKASRSLAFHSHSRFCRNWKAPREGVVVEGGLDLEDLDAAVGDEPSHPPVGGVQLGAVLVHERLGSPHGGRIVVVAEARVAGQPGGHALVARRPWPPG